MIAKETFVSTMERLQELNAKIDAVDDALRQLSPDFGGIYVPEVSTIVFDLFKEVMEDKDDWIEYFAWERNWLKDIKLGDVEIDGTPVKIKTWEDVYDFLIDLQEEEQN